MIYKAELFLEGKIPSENFIYKPGKTKYGKVYLYKTSKIKKYQEELIEKGEITELINIRKLDRIVSLRVNLLFNLTENLFKRDATNMVKATEDAITKIIGVDDSKTTHLKVHKELTTQERESILVEITVIQQPPCLCGCGKHPKTITAKWVKGHDKIRTSIPLEARLKSSRSRTGKKPTLSPYVPNLLVSFNEKVGRWIAAKNPYTSHSGYHAQVVYHHFWGEIPEGYQVHHKTGKHCELEDDKPENLMLLPREWNLRVFPVLVKFSGFDEETVSNVYKETLGTVAEEDLFLEICKRLISLKES